MSNPRLIAAIQTCRRQVPHLVEDEPWREFLAKHTKQTSLKAMDGRQLGRVMDALHEAGAPRKAGARAGRPQLDQRPQMRLIRALWIELHKAGAVRDASEKALDRFVQRITQKSVLAWCGAAELNKVIEALKDWRDRTDAKDPVVQLRRQHPEDAALIEALWDALIATGGMKRGAFANRDTWMLRNFGMTSPRALPAEQAAQAVKLLGGWLRKALEAQRVRELAAEARAPQAVEA